MATTAPDSLPLSTPAPAFTLPDVVGDNPVSLADFADDSPAKLRAMAVDHGFPFPTLYDETQDVARAYTAACTPDFFLFGPDLTLTYRGRLDGQHPGQWPTRYRQRPPLRTRRHARRLSRPHSPRAESRLLDQVAVNALDKKSTAS